jgi:hypothetical protein
MKFLLPVGGVVDYRFGILASPQHMGIPAGIQEGMDWAGDPGCLSGPEFVKRFNREVVLLWLEAMNPYSETCLFIAAPDHVGNAAATVAALEEFSVMLRAWPIAFVAQDGQESLPFPSQRWETLFIGGSTEWKISDACISVIKRAQVLGKRIHIGRVNNWRRYEHFRSLKGSEEFTCDGTKQRFIGIERTIALWSDYQERVYQARLPLPCGNRSGQSDCE